MPVLKTVLWNSKNKTHTGFVSLSYTQAELHLWCPHPRSGFPGLPADIWKQILAVSLYFGRSIRTQEGTHSALVEGGRIMSSEVRELVKGPDHFPSRFLKWPLWLGVATKPPRSLQMRSRLDHEGIHCPSKSCFGMRWQVSPDGGALLLVCLRHASRGCYGLNCVPQVHNLNS